MYLRNTPVNITVNGNLMFEIALNNMILKTDSVRKLLRTFENITGPVTCMDIPLAPPRVVAFVTGTERMVL